MRKQAWALEVQLRRRDYTMRIKNKLLRRTSIEVLVPLNSLFQFYDSDVDGLGDFYLVVEDCHHQLTVVLQHGALTSGENV
jgi:hypothetical protein